MLDDGRPLGESNAILWYFGDGTKYVPDDRYERAQVLQWQFFEQYSHEPNIAVARFLIAYSELPRERYEERLPGLMKGGRTRRSAPGSIAWPGSPGTCPSACSRCPCASASRRARPGRCTSGTR